MAACFCLMRKGSTVPVPLNQIDEELCAHFGVEVNPRRYYYEWYSFIGFLLAMGNTFEEIFDQIDAHDVRGLEICLWFSEHFTSDAWMDR